MNSLPKLKQTAGCLLVMAFTLVSCDTFEAEVAPSLEDHVITVDYKSIYVLKNNAAVFDLTTGVESNKPVLISIIRNPSNGDLDPVGKGVYAYTPDETFTSGQDNLIVKIASTDGNLEVKDTIVFNVTEDTGDLPCDYYAINEEVTLDTPGQTIEIDVLANDVTCDDRIAIPSSLKVLHNTSNGTAEVVNGKIRFTHNADMPFSGSIFYTVNLSDCPECTRAAYVKLLGRTAENCTQTVLNADRLVVSTDGPVTFQNENTYSRIRVMYNDIFCGDDAAAEKSLSIVSGPQFGTAQLSETGDFIKYWMPMNTVIDLTDTITYEVCVSENCMTQVAYLSVRFNATCAMYPQADEFNVAGSDDGSYMLDVLANDELCELADFAVIKITQQPAHGTLTVEDGKIRYKNAASSFSDQFKYNVCTTNGYCSNIPVLVTVTR